MKIERLELYGYERLQLKNIRHFVYTPSSSYQLILGTNGSGKSSILAELSPLPGHTSNFIKDGYKKITISHRDKIYQCDSTFKTGKHSFTVDGEELNPGGTQEVQKMLCEQHFGITKEIHELLTGEIRFSEMSPAERRKWITFISAADYTYAMGRFKTVASKARDQQGALKHLKGRIATETHNLQTLEEIEGLDVRAAKLREELNQLMLERTPNLRSLQSYEAELQRNYDKINELAHVFFREYVYPPKGKGYRGVEDVHNDLTAINANLQSSQAVLDRMSSEYSDMESVVNSIQLDTNGQTENLPELIAATQHEIAAIYLQDPVFGHLSNAQEIERDTNAVLDEVIATFRLLPDNMDRRFSREAVQQANMDIRASQDTIDQLSGRLSVLESRRKAMVEAKEMQCPSCKYVWRPGYSDDELAQLHEQQKEGAEKILHHEALIVEKRAFVEECDEHMAHYVRFRGFVSGYPRMRPLWDYILQHQLLLDNPKTQLSVFALWSKEVKNAVMTEQLTERLRRFQEALERQNAIGDTGHFSRRMTKLYGEIEAATRSLHDQRLEQRAIQRYQRKLDEIYQAVSQMEQLDIQCQSIRNVLTDALRNEIIDQAADSHQLELGGILRKLSEKETQESLLRDLENSRLEVELEARAMQILSAALSPNEGLIAEQLAGDIGCLVAQFNSIIESVWTWDMKVLACGLDSELDYKFPVEINSSARRIPDVSKGSKAMRQIVDIAFQLTVMLYKNLNDYPLFLDEPGEGFDETHRINLMAFIRQLMDMNQHSQLFMISHYASSHGSFTNAEVLVLDDSNITVPGTYNQHVTFG